MKKQLDYERNGLLTTLLLVALVISAGSCSDFASINEKKQTKSYANAQKKASKLLQQQPLFTLVNQQKMQLMSQQNKYLSSIRKSSTTKDINIVRLAPDPSAILQKGRSVEFVITPDKKLVAKGKKVIQETSNNISWSGPIENQKGWVGLVLTDKGITGWIQAESSFYKIVPIGGNLHAIIKIDQSILLTDASPQYPSGALIDTASGYVVKNVQKKKADALSVNDGPVIDVLVAYTSAAAQAAYDINGVIQCSINQTNTTYSNSSIFFDLRLVHSVQVNYNEAGLNYGQIVDDLQGTSDGEMSNLHSLRNQYKADVVILITKRRIQVGNGYIVGRAYEILANSMTAYAALDYQSACNFTFAHEIGHLQGARHNMGEDSNITPFKYGHGYVSPTNDWHTVMAYKSSCGIGCQSIPYWSNPDLNYSGQQLGDYTYADNARVLSNTFYEIRDFRTLPTVSNFTFENPYDMGGHPRFSWSPIPEPSSINVYRCTPYYGNVTESCFHQIGGSYNGPTEFIDTSVEITDYPYAPCDGDNEREAVYRMTAQNSTGESAYSMMKRTCIEWPF